MTDFTLTQIEATGIQEYIFGSNHLRQNVGASELVYRATTEWVAQLLDRQGVKHNIKRDPKTGWLDADGKLSLNDKSVLKGEIDAEVIYAGGGNALILFTGAPEAHAIEYIGRLTRYALQKARGLSLVTGYIKVKDGDIMADQHKALRKDIAAHKLSRSVSVPLLGLSVTAACVFTGLPAVTLDKDDRLVSQVVQHKLDMAGEPNRQDIQTAEGRLHVILPQVRNSQNHVQERYDFVHDFDLFGEKGESSYLAVIHIDGNGMGDRFLAIADEHSEASQNEAYLRQIRRLSEAVQQKATHALRVTVDRLIQSRDNIKEGTKTKKTFGGIVPIPTKNEQLLLPFRPIVFGGDDVTFVCEGRLALDLAKTYLSALAEGKLPGAREGEEGDPLYARSGIAVVKSHFPFSRAYDLAEALAGSAKNKLKDLVPADEQGKHKGTILDWHFSTSGAILDLNEIRERDYVADTGDSMLMRPIRLDLNSSPPVGSQYWRSWMNFDHMMKTFCSDEWADKRNKVKALRDALRGGAEAVELFRANYGLEVLPDIPQYPTMKKTGWHANECGHFDAIEALDFYVPLHPPQETKS